MDNGFEPRIVVTGDEDLALVFAALTCYIQAMGVRGALSMDIEVIRTMRRAADLAELVGEDLTSRAVRKLAGGIPDDLSGIDSEDQS